jgi:YD repeat-containing protein
MNVKYKKYIDYIVSDIKPPYFMYMRDHYGLKDNECELVLSKLFNQPVTIKGNYVYNNQGNEIYYENSDGYWIKYEYDANGNEIYRENSNGYWYKREYDHNGNEIYYENNSGYWYKEEYDTNGNLIYRETSRGVIRDNR